MGLPLVIFIDMDYFFAACEELRKPELKGKPLVVGTSPEESKMRGVVQTCNYEARKFGVKSGMATALAYRKKPDLIYLASDDSYYEDTSRRIYEKLKDYRMPIEECSIDEFAMDATGNDYDAAFRKGKEMKAAINAELGLPCTLGVSLGKTFAKMACDESKPNGAMLLKEEEIPKFLDPKPVRKLPGIGPRTEERLHNIGIKTIGELAQADVSRLTAELGSLGTYLHILANGMDASQVVDNRGASLSIGRERTMENETNDLSVIDSELDKLSRVVVDEANSRSYLFKTITVKARYSDFTSRIKARTLQNYSNSLDTVRSVSRVLIRQLVAGRPMRKVGVRLSTFSSSKGQRRLIK